MMISRPSTQKLSLAAFCHAHHGPITFAVLTKRYRLVSTSSLRFQPLSHYQFLLRVFIIIFPSVTGAKIQWSITIF